MSSIFNKDYVNITYKEAKTDYPNKFCKHIIETFNIPMGAKMLDIGCGDGTFTKEFENLGLNAYGLDISDSASKKLGKNFKLWNLQQQDYPYEKESFDFIFSKSVVEHLREPDILLDEAYRLLKPGGLFICMTPSWKHSYKEAFYIDHTHVTAFTRYSLETACELSGFKSECEYFYQLPKTWKYPILNIGRRMLSFINLPYRPFYRVKWSDNINKTIRFSKEAMLLCKSYKS